MNINYALLIAIASLLVSLCCGNAFAAEKLNVLVVTGGHGFEEQPFEELFASFGNMDCSFFALKEDSEVFEDITDWPYDVIVLYNMSQKISEKRQQHFLQLLEDGVGLVVLHHAIAAFKDWPEYRKIIGAKYWLEDAEEDGVKHRKSQWEEGVDMPLCIEDAAHPVLAGLEDFVLHDETYKGYDLQPDNHLLLSCTLPGSQKEVAWARSYSNAKVCLIQPGHGAEAYGDASYRRLVRQAIEWVAPE